MTVRIPLSTRKGVILGWTLLDDQDAQVFGIRAWRIQRGKPKVYAIRRTRKRPDPARTILLHREIMGLGPGRFPQVDHINGDTLDNRRCNLRVVTQIENQQNRHGANRNSATGLRGVCLEKGRGKYLIQVQVNGKKFRDRRSTAQDAAEVAAQMRSRLMTHSPECTKEAAVS